MTSNGLPRSWRLRRSELATADLLPADKPIVAAVAGAAHGDFRRYRRDLVAIVLGGSQLHGESRGSAIFSG